MWLRRLYTTADGRDLVAMDSRRRLFGGLLRRMLVLRDDVCTTPWCEAPIVHADHATPVREGGLTGFEEGNGKCARCNQTKEAPGWRTRVITREASHGDPGRDRDRDRDPVRDGDGDGGSASEAGAAGGAGDHAAGAPVRVRTATTARLGNPEPKLGDHQDRGGRSGQGGLAKQCVHRAGPHDGIDTDTHADTDAGAEAERRGLTEGTGTDRRTDASGHFDVSERCARHR